MKTQIKVKCSVLGYELLYLVSAILILIFLVNHRTELSKMYILLLLILIILFLGLYGLASYLKNLHYRLVEILENDRPNS